jgi:hypothetical protein
MADLAARRIYIEIGPPPAAASANIEAGPVVNDRLLDWRQVCCSGQSIGAPDKQKAGKHE